MIAAVNIPNTMVHIKLTTIKQQLQARMHYPTEHLFEDDEFLTLDEAFDELLNGFEKYLIRHNLGSRTQVFYARQRGWMTEKLADMFTDYCIAGWRIV